ncbi:MAG TPA: sodium:calcium antiporter [Clostridia bacterium]|nr:sodium:calcium antiporter [Clostridia bacterium]
MNLNRWLFLAAAAGTVPGIYARLAHTPLSPFAMAALAGIAITCAAFLLLWACDAAQAEISQGLALAVVALIAVLPEYSVDMYFTWQAGKLPDSNYASYAAANMTGANRLVIGVGWPLIVLITWLKSRKAVHLGKERRTEIVLLALATLYAFVIPIKGSLAWYDMVVFLGIYGYYLVLTSRRPPAEIESGGPADELAKLPRPLRRLATLGLFLFAGSAILANSKPFCEGLIASGTLLGVSEFVLVQWLAPVASEAPEFIVAIMFALRGHGSIALASLLSAKLNQWTLLVGMIPGVYSVSSGSLHPLPMSAFQLEEILLTAAQSLLALFMIANLRLSKRYALALFILFAAQLISPWFLSSHHGDTFMGLQASQLHNVFSLLYIGGALILLLEHPSRWLAVFKLNLPSNSKPECQIALENGCHEYPNCEACPRKKPAATKSEAPSFSSGAFSPQPNTVHHGATRPL